MVSIELFTPREATNEFMEIMIKLISDLKELNVKSSVINFVNRKININNIYIECY